MEPRPQRPRSVSGQPPRPASSDQTTQSNGSYASPPGDAHAYQQQGPFDPTTFIAPPRTEYDYSPLDLAPPGERRKRQFVAAAVGGLLVVLLAAVAVFAYLVLKPDNGGKKTNDLAAAQTQVARNQATLSAQQTVVAQASSKETATVAGKGPATVPAGAAASPRAAGGAAASPASNAVVATGSGSGSASKGPTPTQLKKLLPDQSVMPEGLSSVTDNERSLSDVVTALGGSPSVEANLKRWGWSGNEERSFGAPDASQLVAGATTNIVVSVHGFASATGAKDALKMYADYLATQGYQEVQAPQVGDSARMLQITNADGTMNVALYVQQGNVLYRFGGSADGGDPTTNVVNVAQATVALKHG